MSGLHGARVASVTLRIPPGDDRQPRCRDTDVNPDWWVEKDLHPETCGEQGTFTQGHPSLDSKLGQALHEQRQDLMRAKFLCYECPFYDLCLRDSWDEPAHIFAGLDSKDRFRARRDGSIYVPSAPTSKESRAKSAEVKTRFLKGATTDVIAVTLNLAERTVSNYLSAELNHLRDNIRGSATCPKPPPFSTETSLRAFQTGLADSPSWQAESA